MKKNGVIKYCGICKKEFYVSLSRLSQNFCSKKCVYYSFKYRVFSDQWRSKISIGCKKSNVGKWMLGRKLLKSTCIKMSSSRLKNKHWNWKGGISKTKEYCKLYKQCGNAKRYGTKLDVRILQQVYENNIKKYGTLTCYLCLKPIKFGQDSLEHNVSFSRGGTNEYNNLSVSCKSCNSKKHRMTEKEYREKINNEYI